MLVQVHFLNRNSGTKGYKTVIEIIIIQNGQVCKQDSSQLASFFILYNRLLDPNKNMLSAASHTVHVIGQARH